jgi:hypothetical protein
VVLRVAVSMNWRIISDNSPSGLPVVEGGCILLIERSSGLGWEGNIAKRENMMSIGSGCRMGELRRLGCCVSGVNNE